MNKFVKVLLCIVSLLLLFGLVMVLSQYLVIPFFTNFTQSAVQNYAWVAIALAVVVLFYIISTLVALVADLAAPARSRNYEVRDDIGQVEISQKSIESVAKLAAAETPGVQTSTARVKGNPRPGHVKVDVMARVDNNASFGQVGQDIEHRVADRLAGSLGIRPENVHVNLEPLTAEARADMDVPRVQ